MPFLLPAAASAVAAAAPAVAASTATATVGATLTSIATNIAMNVAISAVMSALQPQVGAAGRTSEWTLSPDGPIPFAAGRIGVAGAAVHRATFGPDLMYLGVPGVLSGAGPIDAYESFKADDEAVVFDGNGKATSSQYAGELWFRRTFGAQPDIAVPSPPGLKNGAAMPGWGAQHKLSGKAAYIVVMGENSKGTAFPTGEIKPLIVIRGLKGWDPRLDSTYPGGVGPCRLDNPATWVYLTNPILWALKWSLGLWEGPTLKGAPAHGSATDYQVGGIGAKLSGVDVGAFVACANVADANGWTVCAYPTTDDDKHAVLTSFLQAGGAIYASRAGKISCIQRAAPRASVVTISAADTAGPIEIDTAASRIDRINTIRPRCMSENHRWQLTAIPEVTAQAYRDEDGGTRPRGIDYTYVSNATQAAQLAALQIANTREGIAGIIPLKPHLQKIKPGDAFTITEPGFVLNGLKCLCLSTDFDPTTKIVAVSFVSETDAKYPFALGQSQDPPVAPVLEPVDPRYVSPPGETEWTVVPRPPSVGGAQIPGFDLVGEVDNATATALLVEWGPTDAGPWTQAYLGPPTAERVPLTGVQPNATYYVSTMNIRGQNYSERRIYGPFTAPPLVSNDTVDVGGRPVGELLGDIDQLQDLTAALELANSNVSAALDLLSDDLAAVSNIVSNPVTGLTTQVGTLNTTVAGQALRLSTVEARADTAAAMLKPSANLLVNPTGGDGLKGWTPSGSDGWSTGSDGGGAFFRRAFPSTAGLTATIISDPFTGLVPGATLTVSAEAELSGRTSGNTFVQLDFLNGSGGIVAGGSFARAFANGSGPIVPFSGTAPAGTVAARVQIVMGAVSGDATADMKVRRLKVERGTVATPFSDEATLNAGGTVGLLARSASLETATANLALGKADASRVAVIEARAFGSNLLRKAQWSGSETTYAPWEYYESAVNFAPAVRLAANGYAVPGEGSLQISQGGRNNANDLANLAQFTQVVPVEPSKRYCWSAYTGAISCRLRLIFYFTDAGGNYLSESPVDALAENNAEKPGANPSTFASLKRVAAFATAPANAVNAVLLLRKHDTQGAATPESYAFFSRFMFGEVQPLATEPPAWAPASVESRVTVNEAATADLYGRTYARWQIGAAVPGATAFIQALAETTPGAAPTSSVAIGATQFAVFNPAGGGWKKALEVSNGNVLLSGGLQAGAFIRLGNGQGWPVALKAVDFTATDGEVVSFGTDLGALPTLAFALNNLAPLSSGETYNVYAEGLSATGFTLRAKISIPATPTNQSVTSASTAVTISGYNGRKLARGALPDTADGTYRVTATGSQQATIFGNGGGFGIADNEVYVSTYLTVYAMKGGVWTVAANTQVETIFDPDDYPSGPNDAFEFWNLDEVFTIGTGATEVAVVVTGSSVGGGGIVNALTGLYWQSAGTGSGVRSATPSGQKTKVTVRPQ